MLALGRCTSKFRYEKIEGQQIEALVRGCETMSSGSYALAGHEFPGRNALAVLTERRRRGARVEIPQHFVRGLRLPALRTTD